MNQIKQLEYILQIAAAHIPCKHLIIDAAIGFHGIAPEFYMIGDCKEAGICAAQSLMLKQLRSKGSFNAAEVNEGKRLAGLCAFRLERQILLM